MKMVPFGGLTYSFFLVSKHKGKKDSTKVLGTIEIFFPEDEKIKKNSEYPLKNIRNFL
jgi:hypothetical protein